MKSFSSLPKKVVSLLLSGSTNGADISTSAALDASFGIDHELAVAFGNRIHGAALSTGAAGNAFIGNFVCHLFHLLRSEH